MCIQYIKFNKIDVFLQLLLRLLQTGSGRYKRCMVLPVLRECINNAKTWLFLDFSLFCVTIWTYLIDSDLLPSFILH